MISRQQVVNLMQLTMVLATFRAVHLMKMDSFGKTDPIASSCPFAGGCPFPSTWYTGGIYDGQYCLPAPVWNATQDDRDQGGVDNYTYCYEKCEQDPSCSGVSYKNGGAQWCYFCTEGVSSFKYVNPEDFAAYGASLNLALKPCPTNQIRDPKTHNQCASCNSGYYPGGTTCVAYSCTTSSSGSSCQTCVGQTSRTGHNQCASCNSGYTPNGTSCVAPASYTDVGEGMCRDSSGRYTNHYWKLGFTSEADCQSTCSAQSKCTAFNYYPPNGECGVFTPSDSTGGTLFSSDWNYEAGNGATSVTVGQSRGTTVPGVCKVWK